MAKPELDPEPAPAPSGLSFPLSIETPAQTGRRLVSTSVAAAAMNLWLAALGLFTAPYILGHLGRSAFGLFAIIAVITSHLTNLDLGFGFATARFLSRASAEHNREEAAAVLGTSLTVFLLGGLVAGAILFIGTPWGVRTFAHVPRSLRTDAEATFRISSVILLATLLLNYFSSALQGFGRFAWILASNVIFGTLAAIAAVAAVTAGWGVPGILVLQAAVAGGYCLALAIGVARAAGGWVRPSFDRSTARAMAKFGAAVLAAGIAYQALMSGPPTVLAANVASSAVPPFSIPFTVLTKLILLVGSASLVAFPFASAASVHTDRSRLAAAFESHVRLTVLVMGPIVAYLVIFGRPLLSAWISPSFAHDAAPCLRILAIAALVIALSAPPADVARALNRPWWVVAFTAVVAGLTIALSIALVSSNGVVGVSLAMLIATLVGTLPLLFVVSERLLAISAIQVLKHLGRPLLAVGAISLAFIGAASIRPEIILALGAGAALSAAYAAAVYRYVLYERERSAVALHRRSR